MTSIIEAIHVDLDTVDVQAREGLTTPNERQRAREYHDPVAKKRFLARRAAMRMIVASRLGVAPGEIDILIDPAGRPLVRGGKVQISQSTRGQNMIAALAWDRAVGCDVESHHQTIDMPSIARFCFTPSEQRAVLAAMPEVRARLFYGIWTCKEAFLKATGTGLCVEMASVETLYAVDPGTVRGQTDWMWRSWRPCRDLSAAVVARGTDWSLEHRKFSATQAF